MNLRNQSKIRNQPGRVLTIPLGGQLSWRPAAKHTGGALNSVRRSVVKDPEMKRELPWLSPDFHWENEPSPQEAVRREGWELESPPLGSGIGRRSRRKNLAKRLFALASDRLRILLDEAGSLGPWIVFACLILRALLPHAPALTRMMIG